MRRIILVSLALVILFGSGCGTTTQRIATEQLLISDAVDRAIERIDFHAVRGEKVYLDTKYLIGLKGPGVVNMNYVISGLRQQLLAANCQIQEKAEDADVVIEPRVGALGTDGHEVTYGLPQTSSITSAAALLPNAPLLPSIPEISIGRSDAQTGMAKIVVFAYHRETRLPIWQSGIAKAESTSKNSWFMGAGPFQQGSIYDGMRFAGQNIKKDKENDDGVNRVDYASEYFFPREKIKEHDRSKRVADVPPENTKK